jgi:hypothetical protein
VKDAGLRLVEQGARFRAAGRKHKVPPLRFAPVGMTELLREGIARADREEFIEEEGMDARIERMLNSSFGFPNRESDSALCSLCS